MQVLAGRWVEDGSGKVAGGGKGKGAASAAGAVVAEPSKKRPKASRGGSDSGRTINYAGFTGPVPDEAKAPVKVAGDGTGTPDKLVLSRTKGFRGDGRWIGLDVVRSTSGGDGARTVLALSEAGLLYAADNMQLLCDVEGDASGGRAEE